jgi:hypothetical protein
MHKLIFIALTLITLSGCTAIRVENVTSIELKEKLTIVVMEDGPTRDSVLPVVVNKLESMNYVVKVIDDGSHVEANAYLLNYRAWWSWDLAMYMSKSDMTIKQNNAILGQVQYRGKGGLNMAKWGSAEERLGIMIDVMLKKIDVEEANKRINASPKESKINNS